MARGTQTRRRTRTHRSGDTLRRRGMRASCQRDTRKVHRHDTRCLRRRMDGSTTTPCRGSSPTVIRRAEIGRDGMFGGSAFRPSPPNSTESMCGTPPRKTGRNAWFVVAERCARSSGRVGFASKTRLDGRGCARLPARTTRRRRAAAHAWDLGEAYDRGPRSAGTFASASDGHATDYANLMSVAPRTSEGFAGAYGGYASQLRERLRRRQVPCISGPNTCWLGQNT